MTRKETNQVMKIINKKNKELWLNEKIITITNIQRFLKLDFMLAKGIINELTEEWYIIKKENWLYEILDFKSDPKIK